MARPQKENLDYFPHDCRASSNELLEIFEMKYPNGIGYSWYFKTLERIYFHQGKLDISASETRQILCKNLSVKHDEIIEYAINIGLFSKKEYEENGVLTSEEIKNNVKPVLLKREKMAQKYSKGVSESETKQKPIKKQGKTPIVEESIGKKRKVNNTLSASSKADIGFNLENKKQSITEFDKHAAAHLEKAVRKLPPRKTGITNAKPTLWARHILLLRTKDNIGEQEIKRTLKWYCQHIGEEYVPEAFSGEAFRKKYPAIVRQCEKANMEPIKISQEARELVKDLSTLSWPAPALESLPAAIQMSLTAFDKWYWDLISYSKKLTADYEAWIKNNLPPGRKKTAPGNIRFVEWLVSTVPGRIHFIRGWFIELNRITVNWFQWNGDLTKFAFRIENKRFQKIGEQWAIEFTGNADRWTEFYNAMMTEMK
jgi:hypothetical protein